MIVAGCSAVNAASMLASGSATSTAWNGKPLRMQANAATTKNGSSCGSTIAITRPDASAEPCSSSTRDSCCACGGHRRQMGCVAAASAARELAATRMRCWVHACWWGGVGPERVPAAAAPARCTASPPRARGPPAPRTRCCLPAPRVQAPTTPAWELGATAERARSLTRSRGARQAVRRFFHVVGAGCWGRAGRQLTAPAERAMRWPRACGSPACALSGSRRAVAGRC